MASRAPCKTLNRRWTAALWSLLFVLLGQGCASRPPAAFQVIRSAPDYVLRSPEARETPFEEVAAEFTSLGAAWVELRPYMQLRIDRAYFREGAAKRDLSTYIGVETARYSVRRGGRLQLLPVETRLSNRPADQAAVDRILPAKLANLRFHRYFYQIAFSRRAGERTAVLLHSRTGKGLDSLTRGLLENPDAVCTAGAACTVFPSFTTVSLQMEIAVNGAMQPVIWGSRLDAVAAGHPDARLFRPHGGKMVEVKFDPEDRQARRVPLLPGDRIVWTH